MNQSDIGPIEDRKKAVASFAIALKGHNPEQFVVVRGVTLPADHPAVKKAPKMFVSADYADADLPNAWNAVAREQTARAAKARAIEPKDAVVAIVDVRDIDPTADGNRFRAIKPGTVLHKNDVAVRRHRGAFKPYLKMVEAGRIGKHGNLLPVQRQLEETPKLSLEAFRKAAAK